jgi:hypothetical protein
VLFENAKPVNAEVAERREDVAAENEEPIIERDRLIRRILARDRRVPRLFDFEFSSCPLPV